MNRESGRECACVFLPVYIYVRACARVCVCAQLHKRLACVDNVLRHKSFVLVFVVVEQHDDIVRYTLSLSKSVYLGYVQTKQKNRHSHRQETNK